MFHLLVILHNQAPKHTIAEPNPGDKIGFGVEKFGSQANNNIEERFSRIRTLSRQTPTHWIQHTAGPDKGVYSGPNDWYSVWFPPTWTLEVAEGTVGLTAPDGGGVLTLTCFWRESPEVAEIQKLLEIERLFPCRRNVRQLKLGDTADRGIGFQGQALLSGETPWWRRVFRKKQWRNWRIWSLRRGSVSVLALYLQSDKPDHEAESIAGMIVNSIEFNGDPACPPEIFSQRVIDLARSKFPLLDCEAIADFQIRLGESKVNLINFYRSYLNAPEQFDSIVLPALATVVQVQGWGKNQTEPELEMVKSRIMPMLYPEDVWHDRFPNFVGTPWVGGLVVLYVIDESRAYWYIRDDLIESWNLSPDELHRIALENLNRYFEDQPMEFTVAGEEQGPRLLVPARQDAYNTSRLLSESFHEKLRGILGGEFAVGTPSRDFFVAISLDSSETVEHVRKKVKDDFQNMDHPLSERMLLVTHDGVTEYTPW